MEIKRILPLLEKGLTARQGRLVSLAEIRVADKVFLNSGLGKSGLGNLLDVAKESPHVAIVTNFLRYQVGRNSDSRPAKWATQVMYEELPKVTDEEVAGGAVSTMAIGEWIAEDIEHIIAQD